MITVDGKSQEILPHKEGGKDPKWPAQELRFERKISTKTVEVKVLDDDIMNDDLMGIGSIDISNECGDQEGEKILKVPIYKENGQENGSVEVKVTFSFQKFIWVLRAEVKFLYDMVILAFVSIVFCVLFLNAEFKLINLPNSNEPHPNST